MTRVGMRRQLGLWLAMVMMVALGLSYQQTQHSPKAAAASAYDSAIQKGVNEAAAQGVTQYILVIDRQTNQPVAWTNNAWERVGSESLIKVILAAYWLHMTDGNPAAAPCDMWRMIVGSNDSAGSACWRSDAMAWARAQYGLIDTYNDPTNPGYWGATRVTAADMAWLVWHVLEDPLVSDWISEAMIATADKGDDAYDQNFGFNAIAGVGNKQGWGNDSYWRGPLAIHSVGFTDRYVASVLQTAPTWVAESTMRVAATRTASYINNAAPANPAMAKWVSAQWLGAPVGGYTCGLVRNGCYQLFANGRIMVHDGHAATLSGQYLDRWAKQDYERGWLGYPTSDANDQVRGWSFQDFEGGSLLLSPWGSVYESRGPIRKAWGQAGWYTSPVGYPTSDVMALSGGSWQNYETGRIMASDAGAYLTYGPILGKYGQIGYENGWAGYPTSPIWDAGWGWKYQDFQGGSLLQSPSGTVYESRGPARAEWSRLGWGPGKLGFPVSGLMGPLRDGWQWQQYQNGRVMVDVNAGKGYAMYGAILNSWAWQGYENGALGYPTGVEECADGYCTQTFEGGALQWSAATGQVSTLTNTAANQRSRVQQAPSPTVSVTQTASPTPALSPLAVPPAETSPAEASNAPETVDAQPSAVQTDGQTAYRVPQSPSVTPSDR